MARNMPKGVQVAPLFSRLVAWLIDVSVPAVLGTLAWWLQPRIESQSVALVVLIGLGLLQLAWGLLLWWGYGTRGAGVGFSVMKLQLVGLTDGRPVGWWRYFLRQLVWSALMGTVVGGVFMLIFLLIHERHQGWHDLAAKSVAIRARERVVGKPRSVAAPRTNHSTTVALPPHLVAKAFEGREQAPQPVTDPAEIARQAAMFGGGYTGQAAPGAVPVQPMGEATWRPPSAPAAVPQQPVGMPEPPTGRQPAPAPQQQWQRPPGSDQGETAVRPRRLDLADDEGGTHLAVRPQAAPRAGNEGWYIVLDDGRQVDVTGLVVIGRKPTQPVGVADARLVPAGDGGHAVSKNHLQVGVDTRGLWITDTGSTNGTAVVNVRGDLEPCQPGVQVRVREGQVVSFGDRTMTVRRKPAF
ncbi:RDD family protein [Propionibacteriaceae bacterium G1746]|uniref:RDD family protein n=1 Tax=Aestuariimicrobium sp. G57 TaxID=3418485 RepID=UPI003C2351B4